MKIKLANSYKDIISVENLLEAWREFLRGKKSREDVQEFERNLMSNICALHQDLKDKTYVHGTYKAFKISDPKPRNIHKALVRDRLLHHALYRILYPFFNKTFISDLYSCRIYKGTHRAVGRFKKISNKVSKRQTRSCWVLKCDIRKFFASIDQTILLNILKKNIEDKDTLWLLERVIASFNSGKEGIGLPLGNLTSQLLVNIYMNEFDQYVKHILKEKYYIRYADDFVFLNNDKGKFLELIPKISDFLEENLKLKLHPDKLFIKTLSSGLDFLGWVNFSKHRVLRTVTKKRMLKSVKQKNECGDEEKIESTVNSYLGMLKWGNWYKLSKRIGLG